MLLVPGLGEHIGRYERLAQWLRTRGWMVVGYDHRGHGRSGGKRGVLGLRTDLITDLATVVDTTRPANGTPLILLGHSMGGLLVAQFVAEEVRSVDAIVMSSPALGADLTWWQRLQLALSSLAPDLAIPNGFDPSCISHDPAVVRAYRDDPLVHDRLSGRLVRALFDGGMRVLERAPQWSVPTLLMFSGSDRLVSEAGSATFAARAPAGVVEAHRYAELFHEIFNEIASAPVYATLERWLDERFPPALT